MAPAEVTHRSRRSHSERPTTKSRSSHTHSQRDATAPADASTAEKPQDIGALRKARLDYLETPADERRKKMKYIGETVTKVVVTKEDVRHARKASTTSKAKRRDTDSSSKVARRKARGAEHAGEGSDDDYVYGRPRADQGNDDAARMQASRTTSGEIPHRSRTRRKSASRDARVAEERRSPLRRNTEPPRRGKSLGIDEVNSSSQKTERPALRKSNTGTKDSSGPSLQRSAISNRPRTELSVAQSTTTTESARKGSLFSGLFRTPVAVPEKQVSCLTCGSDDVPIRRSAKLACSHRMCHTCLRRIFTMSVTDPAHMPPRCCTSEHIPLKHVDELFDQKFKVNWNRKFAEYTTRNRIYCPSRGCGEWIKPNHISIENGRKVGKCKRCGTRACCICNQKMHVSRECPKDPATKQFVEVAKEKGWQKCYSCSAMVELKEGCNHMTCRCTAEFCMVCGLKWKSCDCPWFNYEQVDAHLGNPARYQQELDRRRDQEQRDAALARRMEGLGVDDVNGEFGIGNGADHHMNQNFIQQAREALTANYAHAEQAARGLLNGLMTGRENPLAGMPLPANQTAQVLRQGNQVADPAEAAAIPNRPLERRATRRSTVRRPSAVADLFTGRSQTTNERAQDQRIQDWANRVPVGAERT